MSQPQEPGQPQWEAPPPQPGENPPAGDHGQPFGPPGVPQGPPPGVQWGTQAGGPPQPGGPPGPGYPGVPYQQPGPFGPGGPQAAPGRGLNWFGLVVAGAAILLLVSAVLPWVKVTLQVEGFTSGASHSLDRSFNGFEGTVGWGYLTLLCALAAGGLGVVGGVLPNGRLVGATAIPGLLGLVSLGLAATRFDSAKSAVLDGQPRALPPVVRVLLEKQLHASLDFGWFLALLMSLVITGVGVAAFVVAAGRSSGPVPQPPLPRQ